MRSADNIGEVGSGNFALQVANATQSALKPFGLRAEDIRFATQSGERARIDSSGNLLVSRTSTSGVDTDGHVLFESGESYQSATSNAVQFINRNGTEGNLLQLYKSGTHKGNLGTRDSAATSTVYLASGTSSTGTGLKFVAAVGTNSVLPCRGDGTSVDNVIDLGSSSTRFDDIYATNGTIQTSDRNEKQDIQELSDAEQQE